MGGRSINDIPIRNIYQASLISLSFVLFLDLFTADNREVPAKRSSPQGAGSFAGADGCDEAGSCAGRTSDFALGST
jgi:hypothetical protein